PIDRIVLGTKNGYELFFMLGCTRLNSITFIFSNHYATLFLHKIFCIMERQARKNRGIYWLLFLLSTAAMIFAIYSHWPWLTLILPFVTTFFVLAMDIM